MRTFHLLYLRLFLFLLTSSVLPAAVLFEDGFESGTLGPQWTIDTSNDGRVTVSTNFNPASGQWHMVLDDAVPDALYSSATATLRLNLFNKRNVILSFKAKSLGNEPNYGGVSPVDFDGLAISLDGGATWQFVSSWYEFANMGTEWKDFAIRLDDFGYSDNPGRVLPSDARIRFLEYDNAPAPLDGIAIDDVLVTGDDDQRALLEMADTVLEGTGPLTGYVVLSFPPTNALTLSLSASPTNQLLLPTTVEVPAGQKYASFTYSVPDDSVANLTRQVLVNTEAQDVRSFPRTVSIIDDDAPVMSLSLPSQMNEGESSNAIVTLSRPADVPIALNFSAVPYDEINFFNQVTIPPGTTNVVVPLYVQDDYRLDGNVLVTVSVYSPGLSTATAQIKTIDNDQPGLAIQLPSTILEGSTSGAGYVMLSGILATNLQVSLTNTNELLITVPAEVVVPAGSWGQEFPVQARNNSLRDGTRTVSISGSATGFPGTNATITIRDDEVAAFRFGGVTDLVDPGRPLPITLSAVDVEGNVIESLDGDVTLSLVLADGTLQPVIPASVHLSGGGGWQGEITLPSVQSSSLHLRATDASGNSGDSALFDLLHVLRSRVADLVWDRVRSRFYASVPANSQDTNANQVLAIDPSTGQVTGGVQLSQDPGQMALTSGGESLYVVLNSNGTIARIDPSTMTVQSTFPVGTEPSSGTLYGGDISAVEGQPDLLVVAQTRNGNWPFFNRVAVYDNGVARTARTPDRAGITMITASSSPDVFYSYTFQGASPGIRRLHLDASGLVEVSVSTSLDLGSADIRSDQDKLFALNGVVVDGNQLARLGALPTSGPVCPDLAAGRVYFSEYGTFPQWPFYGYQIGAYDPARLSAIRRFSLPSTINPPLTLIRWGTNGLALRTQTEIAWISSRQMVPSDLPADLNVTAAATPNPAEVGAPLSYFLTVTNQGPNIARGTVLTATLSEGQSIQGVVVSGGTFLATNNSVVVVAADLLPGSVQTATITTLPLSAGGLNCSAIVTSEAVDPNFADNTASAGVGAVFQTLIDSASHLRLGANNLINDPTRNRLWATISATTSPPGPGAIVSIDPLTGALSDPIPINGNPTPGCMALSSNGRYLYVGLSSSPELLRMDLQSGAATTRIPLGQNVSGQPQSAWDIEPLAGDGLSVLVTGSGDSAAAVYDDRVRRPVRTGGGTVTRIEPTADPGIFIGYVYQQVCRLAVTTSGVSVTQSVNYLIPSTGEIRAAGNLMLTDSGYLVDDRNLTLKADFKAGGSPCLDPANHRAYLATYYAIRGFDTLTGLTTGDIALPPSSGYQSPTVCLRWGLDGFAILGGDGDVYIVRSSKVQAPADANDDGLLDSWEATYFETLNVNPAADADGDGLSNFEEYLFGTSPIEPDGNPIQLSTTNVTGQFALRLVFPRRAGLDPRPYDYSISPDLSQWSAAQNASETILSTQTVDGVLLETVETIIPFPTDTTGFLRFEWKPH